MATLGSFKAKLEKLEKNKSSLKSNVAKLGLPDGNYYLFPDKLCITLFSEQGVVNVFNSFNDNSNDLPSDSNLLKTIFTSTLLTTKVKDGWLFIPSSCADYLGVRKNCLMIGMGDRIELWNERLFNQVSEQVNEQLSRASDVFEPRNPMGFNVESTKNVGDNEK